VWHRRKGANHGYGALVSNLGRNSRVSNVDDLTAKRIVLVQLVDVAIPMPCDVIAECIDGAGSRAAGRSVIQQFLHDACFETFDNVAHRSFLPSDQAAALVFAL
jgi:hypothetical protein